MDMNQIRTYAAWISLGADLFLVASMIVAASLPSGLPRQPTMTIAATALSVAVIMGLLGLPRWPAIIGLGAAGLIFLFFLALSY
jgi:hypothetical protein